jgi:hypothetical protein
MSGPPIDSSAVRHTTLTLGDMGKPIAMRYTPPGALAYVIDVYALTTCPTLSQPILNAHDLDRAPTIARRE